MLEEADVPVAAARQVLIRTEAIGANFADAKMRAGSGGISERPLPGALTEDAFADFVARGTRGVDVIADSVGGETLLQGLELLAPFGRTVVYGAAGG